MKYNLRNYITIFFKFTISFGLLFYLFYLVDLKEIKEHLGQCDFYWLTAYVLLAFLSYVISSWKWWILCEGVSIKVSLYQTTKIYFIGVFYNNFLPTSVGGDVVRGYKLSQYGCPLSVAYASIFMERYTGLVTLVAFILITVPFDQRFNSDGHIQFLVSVLTIGFVFGNWMVFSPTFLKILEKIFPQNIFQKIFIKIKKLQNAIFAYRQYRRTIYLSFLASIIFYLCTIVIFYSGLRTLGIIIPIIQVVPAVSVMLMLFMLPISLGGIGLQEWAHTFVMTALGLPLSIGLSLGLLFRARSILFSILGGFINLFDGKYNKPRQSETLVSAAESSDGNR